MSRVMTWKKEGIQSEQMSPEHVVGEVDGRRAVGEVDLETVVDPRAELHETALVIEGEEGDVDLAGATQFGGRRPEDGAVVLHHRLALHEALGEVVGTVGQAAG